MRIKLDVFEVMRPMPVFKPEMRNANRDGVKGQTRRVMVLPRWSTGNWSDFELDEDGTPLIVDGTTGCLSEIHCPYGSVEDYCYMREPMHAGFGSHAYYKDDVSIVRHALTGEMIEWRWKKDVLTSIFMPKEAARSIYQYTSIRVERVQDISEEDAIAEGVQLHGGFLAKDTVLSGNLAIDKYAQLWNEINLARGFGWDANPWVWVLGYVEVRDGEN